MLLCSGKTNCPPRKKGESEKAKDDKKAKRNNIPSFIHFIVSKFYRKHIPFNA